MASQIGVKVKSMADGVVVEVQIEPHATVSQLKQRISYIVKTHEKQQILRTAALGELDNLQKLEELGIGDGDEVELTVPEQPKEELVELSDDEGLVLAEEEELPAIPEPLEERDLTDEELDKLGDLKCKIADLLDDGKVAEALGLQTQVILLQPTAMALSKRAELLLKLKPRRPKAASTDATAALQLNPDSCKAYRLQGKALRMLGDYDGALKALGQAQKIDYDDDVEDILKYVTKRCQKLRKVAQQAAQAA